MDHTTFTIYTWGVKRRNLSDWTAKQFAKYAGVRYYEGENLADLFEEFKTQAWELK